MRVNIAHKKNKITSDVRFRELTLLYEHIHFSATWSGVKFTARLQAARTVVYLCDDKGS